MTIFESFFKFAQVMPARFNAGLESTEILNNTGLMFMRYASELSSEIIPVSATSSAFIFFFPLMSNFFKIEYESFINIFFHGIFFWSYFFSQYFIFLINKKKISKILSFLFVSLIYIYLYSRLFGMVVEYVAYFVAVMSIVPFAICIHNGKLNQKFINTYIIFIFILAIILDFIKDYASFGAIIFLIFILFKSKLRFTKIFSIFLLAIYLLTPIVLSHYIEAKQKENYMKLYSHEYEHNNIHGSLLWFSAYSGLGFISEKGLEFSDESAHKFLKEKKPEIKFFATQENQQILKEEFFNIILSDIGFSLRLFGAKFGVIFVYAILISNIGIFYIFTKDFNSKIRVSFLSIFVFYSIFPLITIPGLGYLTGVIGVSLLIFCYTLSIPKSKNLINKLNFFLKGENV